MFKWGGTLTETVLWNNPSPTSSYGENTISDLSITSYNYIKIRFCRGTSYTTGDASLYEVMLPIPFDLGENKSEICGCLAARNSSNGNYLGRRFSITSNTVWFAQAQRIATSGSDNNSAIPLQIIGIY